MSPDPGIRNDPHRCLQCDETRPTCKNCSKQGRPCQYTSEAAVTVPVSAAGPSTNSPHYGLIDFQASDTTSPPNLHRHSSSRGSGSFNDVSNSSTTRDIKLQPLSQSVLWDFELLHHYTRHTYETISDLDHVLPVWQDAAPQEAVSHPFLMHGLLSLAAFHIALTEPSKYKAYADRAMQHYTLALTLYRPVLSNVDQSNCHALFAFSSVAAILAFALSMASRHTHADILQDMNDAFQMLRGIHAVVAMAGEWIVKGPMTPMVRQYVAKEFELPPETQKHLRILEERVYMCEESEERVNGYLAAIATAKNAMQNIGADPDDKTLAFTWPIMVPRPYIEAFLDRTPMSLAILALYAVLLHDIRYYWWCGDRGLRVIEAVRSALDESWDDALHWPVELIGLNHSNPSSSLTQPLPSPAHLSPIKFETM